MSRRFDLESFESFRDLPESAFYAAAGMSPEETWTQIIAGQERALARAVELTLTRQPISAEWIRNAHRMIFEDTFPDDAGRFRGFLANGRPEEVWFGITVGTSQTERLRQMKGAHPNRIVEQLDRATAEFTESSVALRADVATLRDATAACGRLYAKIARVHPFIDGNLRAAWTALQAGLLSLDLPHVAFYDLEAHDAAMDTALRVDGRQSYSPLAELIEQIIRSAS